MATKPAKTTVKIPLKVDVALDIYADTYGFSLEEAQADVAQHLTDAVRNAVNETLSHMAVGATLV